VGPQAAGSALPALMMAVARPQMRHAKEHLQMGLTFVNDLQNWRSSVPREHLMFSWLWLSLRARMVAQESAVTIMSLLMMQD